MLDDGSGPRKTGDVFALSTSTGVVDLAQVGTLAGDVLAVQLRFVCRADDVLVRRVDGGEAGCREACGAGASARLRRSGRVA